jgi:hypothetical protein
MPINRLLQFIIVEVAIFVCVSSLNELPVYAFNESSVGVKKGDWIEYSVNVTGGVPPPKLAIDSYRIEILDVKGAAFQANFIVRYVNGTVDSSVWNYNFTEGQVGGWTIIPKNLGVGDMFYDCSEPANVTIEGEEQQVVAGATRTIIHASDSIRLVKEWDKVTGVYTYSKEQPKNLTLITNAVATNMWSPQILQLNQSEIYIFVISTVVLSLLAFFLLKVVSPKKEEA